MSDHGQAESSEQPAGVVPAARPLSGTINDQMEVDIAFADFYRSTTPQLVGFLLNQGADRTGAEDIVQDVMGDIHRHWRGVTHRRAWVFRAASNSLLRRSKKASREESHDELSEPSALFPQPDAIRELETRHIMLQIVRALPVRQRQVLSWAIAEFTPAEIAEVIGGGMSSSAVRSSLKKARATVRQRMVEQGEGQ
ncbi:RNA polymerase sigma factor [Kitasatospora sp. NPDC004614]|uniref:RNA polymerase sigma factor n=1 Tax=unclassified Kitasatospora TaxID=2633591 RepID=UPI0036A98743